MLCCATFASPRRWWQGTIKAAQSLAAFYTRNFLDHFALVVLLLQLDVFEGRESSPLQLNMIANQMTQKQDSNQVEPNGDPHNPNRALVGWSYSYSCIQPVNDNETREQMNSRHQHGSDDESEESGVVFVTDTIVDPLAVVVEVAYTPVTLATVLRRPIHEAVAHVAVVRVLCCVERLVSRFCEAL